MAQAVTEFLRNASLLGLLNILIAASFIAVGLASFLSGRPRNKYKVLILALVPLFMGLLAMCLATYNLQNSPFYTDGKPSPPALAADRRDALISLMIGTFAAIVFAATGVLARKRKLGSGG